MLPLITKFLSSELSNRPELIHPQSPVAAVGVTPPYPPWLRGWWSLGARNSTRREAEAIRGRALGPLAHWELAHVTGISWGLPACSVLPVQRWAMRRPREESMHPQEEQGHRGALESG